MSASHTEQEMEEVQMEEVDDIIADPEANISADEASDEERELLRAVDGNGNSSNNNSGTSAETDQQNNDGSSQTATAVTSQMSTSQSSLGEHDGDHDENPKYSKKPSIPFAGKDEEIAISVSKTDSESSMLEEDFPHEPPMKTKRRAAKSRMLAMIVIIIAFSGVGGYVYLKMKSPIPSDQEGNEEQIPTPSSQPSSILLSNFTLEYITSLCSRNTLSERGK